MHSLHAQARNGATPSPALLVCGFCIKSAFSDTWGVFGAGFLLFGRPGGQQ